MNRQYRDRVALKMVRNCEAWPHPTAWCLPWAWDRCLPHFAEVVSYPLPRTGAATKRVMSMARWILMAAIVMTGTSSAWALDPVIGPGVGGRSSAPSAVATGAGRSTDDSLAKPGLTVMDFRAGTGV